MTWESCAALGKDANLPVCGGEDGNQCWCGTALNHAKAANASQCNMPCPGNTSQPCGGPFLINVFEYDCELSPTQNNMQWIGWNPTSPPSEFLLEMALWSESVNFSASVLVSILMCVVRNVSR
eukprot:m.171645 g.171645  ORF g.171645 m.171645 type:complete len:123 (-) comp15352_c0_seq7:83-451(-)